MFSILRMSLESMDEPVTARLFHSSRIGQLVLLPNSASPQLELVLVAVVALWSMVLELEYFRLGLASQAYVEDSQVDTASHRALVEGLDAVQAEIGA